MSRFSPVGPASKKETKGDPGKISASIAGSEGGFRRTGSGVGPSTKTVGGGDPGKLAASGGSSDGGFRRTGAAVGPSSKEGSNTDPGKFAASGGEGGFRRTGSSTDRHVAHDSTYQGISTSSDEGLKKLADTPQKDE